MVALAATPAANANTQIQKYFIKIFPLFGSIRHGRGRAIGEGMIRRGCNASPNLRCFRRADRGTFAPLPGDLS
jgi:hypothetical protein